MQSGRRSVRVAVNDCWVAGRFTGPVVLEVHARGAHLVPVAPDAAGVVPLGGTMLPGFVDHHTHLGLVDPAGFSDSPVVEVHDLGWRGAELDRIRRAARGLRVLAAGPFLTEPGGYPLGRDWAPEDAVVELSEPTAAVAAVAGLAAAGVDLVKLVLHEQGESRQGVPEAVVRAARSAGLPVVTHVEGPGQALRALEAGVDAFAHVPWTERLDDALLRAMAARGVHWISTLGIHVGRATDAARAGDNVRRFRAVGGTVVYGTDLGNGQQPAGLNRGELAALVAVGFDGAGLAAALCRPEVDGRMPGPLVRIPGPRPASTSALPDWFASALRWQTWSEKVSPA